MNIIREFKQISVKDGHLRASYEEHNPSLDDTHLIIYENQAGIHPDLSAALQHLAVHVRQIVGLSAEQPVFINGYYRQNAGNTQLLTIYARFGGPDEEGRRNPSNLSARLYIGRDEYAATEQLLTVLSGCEREAVAYIMDGKTFANDVPLTVDDADLFMFTKPIAEC